MEKIFSRISVICIAFKWYIHVNIWLHVQYNRYRSKLNGSSCSYATFIGHPTLSVPGAGTVYPVRYRHPVLSGKIRITFYWIILEVFGECFHTIV